MGFEGVGLLLGNGDPVLVKQGQKCFQLNAK